MAGERWVAHEMRQRGIRPQRSPGLMAGESLALHRRAHSGSQPQRSPGLMAGERPVETVQAGPLRVAATEPRPDGRGKSR